MERSSGSDNGSSLNKARKGVPFPLLFARRGSALDKNDDLPKNLNEKEMTARSEDPTTVEKTDEKWWDK